MKALTSLFKFLVYSNIYVSLCVTAFTQLTYTSFNLPTENLWLILTMVFSFTFFTYNLQRVVKFRSKMNATENLGERLKWVMNNVKYLIAASFVFGLIGLICVFFLNPNCWYVLTPMGLLSFFYVIPFLPLKNKNLTLRQVPFLKIFIIAIVWSIIVIALPFIDSYSFEFFNTQSAPVFYLAITHVFFFIIGITLPFDIRDMKYDQEDQLKTIPIALGIKKSILFSELFLALSLATTFLIFGSNPIFYALLIGHLITMVMVFYSSDKRKEMFFAGLIEGSVILLFLCVVIVKYYFSL